MDEGRAIQGRRCGTDNTNLHGIPGEVIRGVVPDVVGDGIVVNSAGIGTVACGAEAFEILVRVQHTRNEGKTGDSTIGDAVKPVTQADGVVRG